MEVQVWFRDGHVETHRIPERVGRSRSVIDETGGIEYSLSDVDEVADIIDRFYPTPEGWVLDRLIVDNDGTVYVANGTKDHVIISNDEIDEVSVAYVDGQEIALS